MLDRLQRVFYRLRQSGLRTCPTKVAPGSRSSANAEAARLQWGRLLLYVFLAALTVRVLWVAGAYISPIGDHHGYHRSALDWIRTGQYRVQGHLYAYKPPGYPGLLAGIYQCFGRDWRDLGLEAAIDWKERDLLLSHDWKVVGFVQAVFGALSAALLAMLVGKTVSFRAGAIAGALYTLSPVAVAYVPVLANDNLTVLLLLLGLTCHLGARDGRSVPRRLCAGVAGLCLGAMILVRPSSIFFVPAWLLLGVLDPIRRQWRPRALAASVVGTALLVGPWLYYTYSFGLGVGVLSTQGGYGLWWGNNPISIDGGNPPPPRFPSDRELGEREQHTFFMDKALTWIRENPRRYLALCRVRLTRMFGTQEDIWAAKYLFPTFEHDRLLRAVYWPDLYDPDEREEGLQLEQENRRLHRHFRVVTAPLALVALAFACVRPRRHAYLLLPLACYAAGHALTVFAGRYRCSSDPLVLGCLASFLADVVFGSGASGFWRGRWPRISLAALAVTGSIWSHATGLDRTWYRLPAPPEPMPVFDDSLGTLVDVDISDLTRLRIISTRTCAMEVEPREAGLQCILRGVPAREGHQYAGLRIPVAGLAAVRLELTFDHPRNLDTIFVDGRDATGAILQRWEYRVRTPDQRPPVGKPVEYRLVPGKPSGHFRPRTDEPGAVTELRLIVRIVRGTECRFTLNSLTVAIPPADFE